MSIVKRNRSKNFAIIPNQIANDSRLSFEARGLLCYLLAKPGDWQVHVNGIRAAGRIGRDKTYRILQELAEAGYLERIPKRGAHGRFASYDYSRLRGRATRLRSADGRPARLELLRSRGQVVVRRSGAASGRTRCYRSDDFDAMPNHRYR